MFKRIFLFVVPALLAGCAHVVQPTPQQIASADYGTPPTNYQQLVKDYVQETFIDPDSAKYSGFAIQKDYAAPEGFFGPNTTLYGYRVCVEINAKNRMGGYGGKELFYFMVHNNKIVHSASSEKGFLALKEVTAMCGHPAIP